jgi:hypothetical protein
MVMCIPAVRAAQQNQNSPCASRRVRSDYGLSSAKALELAAKKKQQQRRVSAPARLQRLPRPAPALPSRAVLEAVDPALADIPTDYIRDMLTETGARSVAPVYVLLDLELTCDLQLVRRRLLHHCRSTLVRSPD